ncbi:hypothetical protein DICSQDRAFT_108479 [Dichomitus squalens LYAD-421 SS1]|uniref:Cytochrome P450 n=1 Tax=Dichomitus squalens (strain LYAD-421) TaxID=732165 RepID=R7SXX4_DICSQ|nr:uncharacterized protein DICSQDRAFT_108479 [Dichomitus squalens LYAD-421 SS1]EJF59827.1 hypothetical protein DICSQDRAFT_108479 [Dichomitus squalens LYAD-421 SS1]
MVRAPPNPQYVAVYDLPERPEPARSNPPPALSTPSQPRLATASASSAATGHNAAVGSAHVDKRRRTSGPAATPSGIGASATPPATSPGGTPRNAGGTLWRGASYSPLPERVAEAKVPGIYSNLMTFLGGGRACIGFKFSQLEMKVILCLLLSKFTLTPSDKEIHWNLSGVRFPTVDGNSKPSMPMNVALYKGSVHA